MSINQAISDGVNQMLTMLPVYPETSGRSLESIDALFSTSSPFNWAMEKNYQIHGDVLAEPQRTVSAQMEEKESEGTWHVVDSEP